MNDNKYADNWPFKTNNDKEALALGRALIQLLAEPHAEVTIKRRNYFLDATYRASRLGREYTTRQSCYEGNDSLASGFARAAIIRDSIKTEEAP